MKTLRSPKFHIEDSQILGVKLYEMWSPRDLRTPVITYNVFQQSITYVRIFTSCGYMFRHDCTSPHTQADRQVLQINTIRIRNGMLQFRFVLIII